MKKGTGWQKGTVPGHELFALRKKFTGGTVPFCLVAAMWLAVQAQADPIELRVLTYNIHGLPSFIAGDDPPARIPQLLAKAEAYDVVLVQEDFSHQLVVDAHKQHSHLWRGNGPWLAWIGEGAGLTILSRLPSSAAPFAEAYGVCNGWLGAANDCFGNKGFLQVRLALADGGELDVWNTHLDAGRSDADRAVRKLQLEKLATAIESRSGARAVLAGGDLNLEWDDAADRALLEEFAARLGLAIAARTPPDGWDGHLDYLLLRSAGGRCFEAEAAGKDEAFVDAGARPLSDHPAIYARLRPVRCAE